MNSKEAWKIIKRDFIEDRKCSQCNSKCNGCELKKAWETMEWELGDYDYQEFPKTKKDKETIKYKKAVKTVMDVLKEVSID